MKPELVDRIAVALSGRDPDPIPGVTRRTTCIGAGGPGIARPCPRRLRQLAGEHPDPDRRSGRRRRPRRVGGGGLGGARRGGRGARRRGGVPARQDLRRRADPARHRRAAAARPRGLAARPHGQPGPACPRLRPDAAAALAGRHAARLGQRGGPHRARRPPAHHRDQGRRGGGRRCPGGRRTPRGGPGGGRRVPLGLGDATRSPASGWSWPTACARRWARCSVGSGTATPSTRVAGRSYITSEMSDDPWISSHLELRGEDGEILSGYGWIFPLGNGEVNIGVGTLATSKRPAERGDQAADAALRRRAPRGLPAVR